MSRKFFTLLIVLAGFGASFGALADEPGPTTDKVSKPIEQSGGPSIESASSDQLASAMGHYAKSRSLLVAAIREFDKGYKLATPDSLLNSREWRGDLIDRAKELEKVLDPQPRITRGGVKFEAYSDLLNGSGK